MAKSSKVDDYWRQHNVENLLKELTQILVRRMPPDPAIAIVEHLQKKFPKSFKTSTDNTDIFSKTLANNLQMQSINSPQSDVQIERRLSNQSQSSGIVTIPTVGSAFTDLFKQDSNSSKLAPELNIKNLVFANRLSQQAIKMGKDIRSDHDIIEEEVIKPMKINSLPAIDSISEDLQDTQTHEELSVPQLIKYKQQIRSENDRRLHRLELAELAKRQRARENFFQSDLSSKPEEIQQEKFADDESLSQIISEEKKTNINLSDKPIVKSKEEEEILNDENVFQPRKYRERARQKNTPHIHGRYKTDFRSTIKRNDENLICKVCGNSIHGEDNQPIVHSQQNSAAPTSRSFQPQPSSRSIETTSGTVDDWFESSSDASVRQQSNPSAPNDAIPPPTGSSTFRRNLFQPINDIVEHRPPIRPSIPTDDDQTKPPRMSETGMFSRSPEPKIRRSSSSRSTSSPVTKKQQTDTSHQLTKTLAQTIPSTNDRRMSGWSVRERSPDDSDEN